MQSELQEWLEIVPMRTAEQLVKAVVAALK
jgi:hypothetical protein